MKDFDKIANQNRLAWGKRVKNKAPYTQPWLNIKTDLIIDFIQGTLEDLPKPYLFIYPPNILEEVNGKDVLCLASGGGQQTVFFGLSGANVTVFDLCEGQLKSDRLAAEKYGYKIDTIQGDMRNLSTLNDESFDLVYQPISLVFVPDVAIVYKEVSRILRSGGFYRVAHVNPSVSFVSEDLWTGKGYLVPPRSYNHRMLESEDEYKTIEFRHSVSDIFNGLINNGFQIQGVWEDPRSFLDGEDAEPGSYLHYVACFAPYFAILAQKRQ